MLAAYLDLEDDEKLTVFEPEPKYHFSGYRNQNVFRTYIICLDNNDPELDSLVLNKIHTLSFYEDRCGFFESNRDNIVSFASDFEDWDTGLNKSELQVTSKLNVGTLGNRIALNLGSHIAIYEVIGFKLNPANFEGYGYGY